MGIIEKIVNRLIHNENNHLASTLLAFQIIPTTLGGITTVNRPEPKKKKKSSKIWGFSESPRNSKNNMNMGFSVNFSATEGYMIFCGPSSLGNCSYPR